MALLSADNKDTHLLQYTSTTTTTTTTTTVLRPFVRDYPGESVPEAVSYTHLTLPTNREV